MTDGSLSWERTEDRKAISLSKVSMRRAVSGSLRESEAALGSSGSSRLMGIRGLVDAQHSPNPCSEVGPW